MNPAERQAGPRRRGIAAMSVDRVAVLVLIGLCAAFSWARWSAIGQLWGDAPRWIFEVHRVAGGEMPYRDFTWQYPPLSLWLMAGAMRAFGATFAVVQTVLNVLSAVLVILTWALARRFVGPALAFATAAAVACAGGVNDGNFALFSLRMYSPAVLTGTIGLLWFLLGCAAVMRDGRIRASVAAHLVGGATVAVLSKPEAAVGVGGAYAAVVLARVLMIPEPRARVRPLALGAVTGLLLLLPAIVTYAVVAREAGLKPLVQGLSGYGMTTGICPWWPTGKGLLGGLAALGSATLLVAFLSLLWRRSFARTLGRGYVIAWLAAIAGLVVFLAYLRFGIAEFQRTALPAARTRATVTYLFSNTALLLPFMWACVVLTVWWILRAFRSFRMPPEQARLRALPLYFAGAAVATRSLFGGTLGTTTSVPSIGYSLYFIVGATLICSLLELPWHRERDGALAPPKHARLRPELVLAAVLILWSAARVTAWTIVDSQRPSYTLETLAGPIRLADDGTAARLYTYLAQTTARDEPLIDVPDGGGLNFALRRPSPLHTTHFRMFAPDAEDMQRDMQRLAAATPPIVIGHAETALGSWYGLKSPVACALPALVWETRDMPHDPLTPIPVIEWIERRYSPVAQIGDRLVLRYAGEN